MENNNNNNIILKIWDFFIIFLVLLSVFLLIRNYFLLTPSAYNRFETYNSFISLFFLIDLIIRLVIFKREYLKNIHFIIDVLACIDIFLPVFRVLKSIRIIRMMRLFRLARIGRLFKVFNYFESDNDFIIKVALANLIVFSVLSIFLSSFVAKHVNKILVSEYNHFTEGVYYSNSENELRILDILRKGNVLSFRLSDDFSFSILSEDKIKNTYFPDDLIAVDYKDISITFVNKKVTVLKSLIELITILSVVPVIIIVFVISNYRKAIIQNS